MNDLSSQSGEGYEFYSLLHRHTKLNEIKNLVLLPLSAGGTIQFVQELLSEALTSKEASGFTESRCLVNGILNR